MGVERGRKMLVFMNEKIKFDLQLKTQIQMFGKLKKQTLFYKKLINQL